MAKATKCLTTGAQFHTEISPNRVSVSVDIPFNLDLNNESGEELENLLHNAVEMVLAVYWAKQ